VRPGPPGEVVARAVSIARVHKDDIEERVSEYLNEHPLSTTGDLAKGLNADRGKVAAARSQIANAGETAKDHTAR
jgi:hypothetical protein